MSRFDFKKAQETLLINRLNLFLSQRVGSASEKRGASGFLKFI